MVILFNVIYVIPSLRIAFETISEELQSNLNVVQEMIQVRDGVKASISMMFCLSLMTFVLTECSKTSSMLEIYVLLCLTIFF